MASDIKIKKTITVTKEFTIDEGQLQDILLAHGAKVLGVEESSVTVSIECSSSGSYVRSVTFFSESEVVEE